MIASLSTLMYSARSSGLTKVIDQGGSDKISVAICKVRPRKKLLVPDNNVKCLSQWCLFEPHFLYLSLSLNIPKIRDRDRAISRINAVFFLPEKFWLSFSFGIHDKENKCNPIYGSTLETHVATEHRPLARKKLTF